MLSSGTRLGSYEIIGKLGEGGMGEVYRAQDTDLKRQVALKVLPAMVATDPDRIARFQREAEVLATLNHPHIAQIYGLEKSTGTIALVMELVEGPTLADRIAHGPIPLDEALPIAKQIADALTAAHDQGIIHRDLKPANIKVRDDGTVKVLDFGLAKLADPTVSSDANLTISPTLTSPAMTRVGVILGTAAYMAPEQARGKAVDKRGDIWAFGCVLFEMVTGKRLFQGEDLTETLASIVKEQPDLSKAPRQLHRLLTKCLEKDPKKRLRDLGDVWDLLDDGNTPAAPPVVARRSNWLPWTVAGVAIAVAAVSFVARGRSSTSGSRPRHLLLDLPEGTAPAFFALSPDSRSLAMSTQHRVAVRSLETGDLLALTGTEGARAMFWSPDGRTIAFFSPADHKLKTIQAGGGVPQTLCDDVEGTGGGTWGRDGTILFDSRGAVLRTTASGGGCTEVTKATTTNLATNPVFLPDGDHFLYFQGAPDAAQSGVYVASLGEPKGKRLLGDVSSALFAPDAAGSTHGRLLFVREQALMAQAFDAGSLVKSGDPVKVADHVTFTFNALQVAASVGDDGTLIYATNTHHARKMVWYERSGTAGEVVAETGTTYAGPTLSRDGKRLAFLRAEALDPPALFVHDFERKQEVHLTRPPFSLGATAWAPDGQWLAFAGSGSPQTFGLHVISANGGAPKLILPRNDNLTSVAVSDWSRDGRFLFFTVDDPKTAADIWMVPVHPTGSPGADGSAGTPALLLRTSASETQAQLSPDGKWLAYTSMDAGSNTPQVFVRPFTGTAPLPDTWWQVSTTSGPDAGGIEPRWRGDSKELFYLEFLPKERVARLMAVPFGAGPNPAGTPKLLFTFSAVPILQQANVFLYAPSPDGQRFLVDAFASDARPTLEIILKK